MLDKRYHQTERGQKSLLAAKIGYRHSCLTFDNRTDWNYK